jgi:mono/diheme cytochrome c family protein
VYPALKGSAILAKDAELVRSILNGYPPGGRYGGAMPGFARDLSDPQIAALINWMRDEWAPYTPAITAATVAQQRR